MGRPEQTPQNGLRLSLLLMAFNDLDCCSHDAPQIDKGLN